MYVRGICMWYMHVVYARGVCTWHIHSVEKAAEQRNFLTEFRNLWELRCLCEDGHWRIFPSNVWAAMTFARATVNYAMVSLIFFPLIGALSHQNSLNLMKGRKLPSLTLCLTSTSVTSQDLSICPVKVLEHREKHTLMEALTTVPQLLGSFLCRIAPFLWIDMVYWTASIPFLFIIGVWEPRSFLCIVP